MLFLKQILGLNNIIVNCVFNRFAGDIELFSDGQIKIESEKLDATRLVVSLAVRAASLNDAGEFKAVATNVAGTATCSSRLAVSSKFVCHGVVRCTGPFVHRPIN